VRISVAICTWNRAKLLDHCLGGLATVSSPTAVRGLMHGRRVEFDMQHPDGFYGIGLTA